MLLARDTTIASEQAWNLAWGWRWMFWAETLPAALFLLMSFFIPESPVFLQMKEKGTILSGDTSTCLSCEGEVTRGGLSLLGERKYRRVLMLGLVIAVFQQWCGTNVIFNYA